MDNRKKPRRAKLPSSSQPVFVTPTGRQTSSSVSNSSGATNSDLFNTASVMDIKMGYTDNTLDDIDTWNEGRPPALCLFDQPSYLKMGPPAEYPWCYKQDTKLDFMDRVKHNIATNAAPTVKIVIDDITLFGYLKIMTTFSQLFRGCGCEEMILMSPYKISSSGFAAVYSWLTDDDYVIDHRCLIDIMNTALYLRIESLVDQCWAMVTSNFFQEIEAFFIFWQAQCYKELEKLNTLMISRIYKFFLTLVSSEEFQLIDVNHLCMMLRSGYIGVNSEIEIFYAATIWLSHNWPQRKKYIVRVYKCIRYGYIQPLVLVAIINARADTLTPYKPIMKAMQAQPEINAAAQAGLCYSSLHEYYCYKSKLPIDFYTNKLAVVEPHPRRWIYDRKCEYHCFPGACSLHLRSVSFDDFAKYLNMLSQVDTMKHMDTIQEGELPQHTSRRSKPKAGIPAKAKKPKQIPTNQLSVMSA